MKLSTELQIKLNNLKAEADQLMNKEGVKAEEINAKADEIKAMKAKLEYQLQVEADEEAAIQNKVNNDGSKPVDGPTNNKVDIKEVFTKAVANKEMTAEEKAEFKNLVLEGDPAKGGVTVPKDITTDIKVFQDTTRMFDIRPYINIEGVSTLSGTRVIATNQPQAQGFASLDEGAEIQALYEPTFGTYDYTVRKYAGRMPITNELLADNTANIYNYIVRWLGESELNSYCYQVFQGTGNKSAQGIVTEALKGATGVLKDRVEFITSAPTITKFKSIFNVDLESISIENQIIFTNADGLQYLDSLEDKQGRPYLEPDVTKKTQFTLLGRNVVSIPKKFLPTDATKGIPFIIGDLKQLYTMFDRALMSIQSTNVGGSAWTNDLTEVKGIFRFDGKIIYPGAIKVLYAKF